MYKHGHLTRAVSGRITDDLDEILPAGYVSSYPYVGRVTKYDMEVALAEPTVLGLNWSHGDDKLEIIDGMTGRSIDE